MASKTAELNDDALLEAAIARANLERDEASKDNESAAALWQQQRDERDKLGADDEKSVKLVCPEGHFLCFTDRRGRCLSCRKKLHKHAKERCERVA